MGVGTGLYKVVSLLHLVTVIVGFGAVVLNGLYGVEAKNRRGHGGLAIMEATYKVSEVAMVFIYMVPVTGILLIIVSDGVWEFSQLWVSLAFLLYIAGVGLSHGLLRPNLRKMQGLARELAEAGPPPEGAAGPPPQAIEMETRGRTVGVVSTVLNLNLAVLLVLMIWKPGA